MKICIVIIILSFTTACTTTQVSNSTAAKPSPVEEQAGKVNVNTPATPQPSPSVSPARSQTPPQKFEDADVEAAADIIRQYYAAIDARTYRRAYEFWSGKGDASKKTFEEFRNGFAQTKSVRVDIGEPGDMEGAAGSRYITFPVTIHAVTKDGKEQNFKGEYVLRRSVVDGATAEQRAWRIYSAKINES
jgi:hypothetical protein